VRRPPLGYNVSRLTDPSPGGDGMTIPRPWQVLSGYLFAIAVLVGLNPGSGNVWGISTAMIVVWCLGVGVLTLGAVRFHGSRFRIRTLCLLIVAVAVFMGLCRAMHPVIPTMFVAYGLSMAMLAAAQQGGEPRPLRGQWCRLLMMVGGLVFLAFFSLVIFGLLMQSLGWWTR
jgi:hypothetical protein